jgi:hypothetical protein
MTPPPRIPPGTLGHLPCDILIVGICAGAVDE